jgi:hypothetical protein
MHPPAQFVQEPLLQHGERELAEAALDDVLPGGFLEALDLATGSPLIIVVLFHSGFVRVEEMTYLAIELMWSLRESQERVGQTGAKPS